MYEVLMVLIITDFEWTWLSYIIDLLVTYTNTYSYMSCTCQNERACIVTVCCFILFINSCEKYMLKTMHVSKTVENCWICLPLRNRLFPRLCPACVIDMHFVSGECIVVVFCFCFYLYKNLHNCFGHLNIPRSLFISL